MHLYSRTVTLTGPPRASMAWAMEITSYVNAHTDKQTALWSSLFGRPIGTLSWVTWVDSIADLQASFAGLADDDGFHELLGAGREFLLAPPEDALRELISGELMAEGPAVGSVSMMTTATVGNGKYEEAITWGAEMAAHVRTVTQLPSLFLRDVFGTFGQVTWIGGAPNAAAADAAMAAINGDLDYLKRIGDVGDLFVEGSGRQMMSTRIA
jgi:hypothetical protein